MAQEPSASGAKIVVGSGWWCDEASHDWALGSMATRTPDFFDLWYRQVLRCLRPDRVVVTDSASPIKPNPACRNDLQWIQLDKNYGHPNDIRIGRIATKYSGFTRSVINGAMYALCCDADFYVYVEQDCLLFGEDFLSQAVGDSSADILLGSPSRNGKGLNGAIAAPMLQQSLMIVRRSGLERFLIGLLSSPKSDGEVSPEKTMKRRLVPFDFVRLPYGRSRPIDFDLAHFYAQHLDDEELSRFKKKLEMTEFATPPAETGPVARQEDRSLFSEGSIELLRELDEWKRAGKKARIWWRDDDAVSDTPELRRLLALAEEARTVIGLAVIPERADESLVRRVAAGPCCVWQHGWAHHWQYEDAEQSYSQGEFGAGRDLELMMADARNGQLRLDQVFGEGGWQRIFVPPFHALSVPFKMLLPSLGYRGLSAGNPLTPPVHTVAEINAEIDIINWRKRRFHGADTVAGMLTEQLQSRRQGRMEFDAPLGLLTHHLAMDEPAWRFLEDLLRFLARHDAVELLPADRLFAKPPGESPGRSRSPAAEGAEPAALGEVTVVVTSCGRQDLLERTLDSFLQHNTYPIKEFVIIEDGNGDLNLPLMNKYRQHPITWLATGYRVGQVAAIDTAYKTVATEYIFHCEDDWEFFAPGFIEKSMVLLAQDHSILQVWLRALKDTNRQPLLDFELTTEGIPYRLLRHHHDAGDWGTWHGFSWNPGLRRRRDYDLLGSFGSLDPETSRQTWQVESDASAFYQQKGFVAAILADNGGKGYVRHLGRGRRVPRDYIKPSAGAGRPLVGANTFDQPMSHAAKHKVVRWIRQWRDRKLIAGSSLFDRTWYLERYGDVRSAGADPVWHYLSYGAFEGRDPGPNFDSSWYLEQNHDVRRSAMHPLVHYLRHGQSEGRQPRPLQSSQAPRADRDQCARLLMARLSVYPKFDGLTQICDLEHQAGFDEAPDWQIWTDRPTTQGQLRIEEQLESLVKPSTSILHIGAGNSSLGQRFAPRVAKVLGTTLHDEEVEFSERLGLDNYGVLRANKFANDMDSIEGPFDIIVDPNPSTFACCLFHFSRMLMSYAELLKRDGGLFITEKRGLGWVSTDNDPNWALGWDDWARIGDILEMPVVQVTERVYSMQRMPESGLGVSRSVRPTSKSRQLT